MNKSELEAQIAHNEATVMAISDNLKTLKNNLQLVVRKESMKEYLDSLLSKGFSKDEILEGLEITITPKTVYVEKHIQSTAPASTFPYFKQVNLQGEDNNPINNIRINDIQEERAFRIFLTLLEKVGSKYAVFQIILPEKSTFMQQQMKISHFVRNYGYDNKIEILRKNALEYMEKRSSSNVEAIRILKSI